MGSSTLFPQKLRLVRIKGQGKAHCSRLSNKTKPMDAAANFSLTRALEESYKVGQKLVGADMIENVLAKDIDGLEPRLTRQGYNVEGLGRAS
jgi:hypothetical protein